MACIGKREPLDNASEILTVRATRKLLTRIDELAASDSRSRADYVTHLLSRIIEGRPELQVLETIIGTLWDELEKHGESHYTEIMRGQLHAAKWMIHALLGADAKDRTQNEVRRKLGKAIPHCVPMFLDGNRYGIDSDAG